MDNPLGTVSRKIQWTDTFCVGDRFTAYFTSSDFKATSEGSEPILTPTCSFYEADPKEAFLSFAFNKGEVDVFSADPVVNITFVAIISPFSAGRAYARALHFSAPP